MARTSFEDLQVYQLAERLSSLIWEIVGTWHWCAKKVLGWQLIRAADSIGANIAEGCGRWHYADNRRFVRIARGSLYETKHWLRTAYRRNFFLPEQTEQLKVLLNELLPKLNAYLASIDRSARAIKRLPESSPVHE